MINPCKNCEKRHVGCHSDCERYFAWKADLDEKRERERKYADSESMICDGRYRGWKKNKMK